MKNRFKVRDFWIYTTSKAYKRFIAWYKCSCKANMKNISTLFFEVFLPIRLSWWGCIFCRSFKTKIMSINNLSIINFRSYSYKTFYQSTRGSYFSYSERQYFKTVMISVYKVTKLVEIIFTCSSKFDGNMFVLHFVTWNFFV